MTRHAVALSSSNTKTDRVQIFVQIHQPHIWSPLQRLALIPLTSPCGTPNLSSAPKLSCRLLPPHAPVAGSCSSFRFYPKFDFLREAFPSLQAEVDSPRPSVPLRPSCTGLHSTITVCNCAHSYLLLPCLPPPLLGGEQHKSRNHLCLVHQCKSNTQHMLGCSQLVEWIK